MSYKSVQLSKLRVNRNNDRHGEQGSEERAIAWLLTSRATHMRNLARDIVDSGMLYEPPLVTLNGEGFTVLDGNRRVTCLKLLRNPKLAPTAEFERFFSALAAKWDGGVPSSTVCQIEIDGDRIDEILYRRHTGSQGGVGQSAWDDRAKQNFIERTGKKTRIDAADEVCAILRKAGYVVEAQKLPRSNLNRLLSAEAFRNRLGFSIKANKFSLTHAEPAVIMAALKVANDLISKKIVLGTLWDNDAKRNYLNGLEKEGHLPKTEDLRSQSPAVSPARAALSFPAQDRPAPPAVRRHLIPPELDYNIAWTGDAARLRDIWHELSHRLTLSDHPNAVGVLFRLLLEFSVERYASTHDLTFQTNDKLARKVEKVAADLRTSRVIDGRHESELRKFAQDEQIISAQTMNSYVHSPRFSPSPEHLIAMWNVLSDFIVACLTT